MEQREIGWACRRTRWTCTGSVGVVAALPGEAIVRDRWPASVTGIPDAR